jgi:glycosyltransferase involved in cell wall biosynthesis
MLVDKGVLEFIQAAYTLRHRGNKARFILVGALDEKNPASLKINQISDAVSQGVVEWWGHRSDADMPEVLSQAQLVVLPSYREGLPKVLIEAAACGRAIVATDVPGCRDAITPGTTGVLVPARNAQALADAIDNLLEDGDRCREMGEAGRTLAVSVFDVRQVVAAHMAVYRDLGGQQ